MRIFQLLIWGAGFLICSIYPLDAHQTEFGSGSFKSGGISSFLMKLEAGSFDSPGMPGSLLYLAEGRYQKALDSLSPALPTEDAWFKPYLENLIQVSSGMVKNGSEHFILATPPDQAFLSQYALPALEKMGSHIEKVLHHRPKGKILVEIYPDREDFSKASTLSEETLERSGAIGICKFHRLMILSPQGLPLGYRWLDTLTHEYTHLVINEISQAKMELWLHEGIARYFDTSYRADPPLFLTPSSKTKLLEASEQKKLIPFARMSPSMVYLDNQDDVSLAFAEVSHAISVLVKEKDGEKLFSFLEISGRGGSRKAFVDVYKMSQEEFENYWKENLSEENWPKVKGAMTDEIRFSKADEESFVGANVQGQIRLGDKMRQKGLLDAALFQYHRALEEEPDNAVILLKIARTYLTLIKPREAIPYLRKAVEKNPNYGTPHIELASLVSPGEAIPLLLEANAINPFDPRIHKGLAESYDKLGEKKKAEGEQEIWQLLVSGE